MKILTTLIKRLEVIAFFCGFAVGIYILVFFPAKYFFAWHPLPSPPEPVLKIISANHMGDIIVTTASNKNFICDLDNEKECWTEIDYEPLVNGRVLCFMGDCPDSHTMQIMKVTGRLHNFGELSFLYSLGDDGIIHVRQMGSVYLPGYMMGALLGGLSAFIAFISKYLFSGIIFLSKRGLIR
jgi:hypothetical protein